MENENLKIFKQTYLLINLLTYSLMISLPCSAFEDCLVTSDGKLTEIKLENNQIIDVCPIFTLMNDKNTLYVHPLKKGETKFSVLKNGKERHTFSVKINSETTLVEGDSDFEILAVDTPPNAYEFELDEPPTVNQISKEGRNYGE